MPPLFFTPWRQDRDGVAELLRASRCRARSSLLGVIPQLLARLDPALPVEDLKTMPQQIKENIFLDRMISILSASFALLATLLAGVGLYGVLSYTVSQRTREIGVRMALGAIADHGARTDSPTDRRWMTVIGGTFGVLAAYGLGKAAQSLLYGLEGHDPIVFALAVVLLAAIALTAGFIRHDGPHESIPMQALRHD